jgi:hypothetical protein
MELTRRFVFKGYASALSGLIYVPNVSVVDLSAGGSCALGIAGGRARSDAKDLAFGDAVRVGSATTLAQGVFDDEKAATAVVSRKGRQDELSSTTTVSADLREMRVGNNRGPFFTASRVRATLVSRSPEGSGEPRIAPGKETAIEGVAIDGHALSISLNLQLFQTCDTRSKLAAAADDKKTAKASRRSLALTTTVEGQGSTRPRLVSSQDIIYTTVVREIRWTGKPFPGAKIDEHTVVVPDFGRIFFGELLVSTMERRLTMVRFELGSPLRGYVGGGDVGSDGSWYP